VRYWLDRCTRDGIRGWAFGEHGPATVRIFINGRPADFPLIRLARPDVAKACPEYPYSGESGFHVELPLGPLEPEGRVATVCIELADGDDAQRIETRMPSSISADPARTSYWRDKRSPFPPEVMAAIESGSENAWADIGTWSAGEIEEAVEVLLFLLKTGSRVRSQLFSYFAFLNRIAHAFEFAAANFPNGSPRMGKDAEAVASSPQEHFLISHHLLTLKAHGLDGDLAEFGCFKGFSTSCLSFACALLGMRMHVFDSFEGLPSSESGYYRAGDFAGSLEEVSRNIANFGSPQAVSFHKGFFADVVPTLALGPLACIWMDVDLEISARDALQVLPKLDPRGCLFAHECAPELFDDNGDIVEWRGPEAVLPPVKDAFIADRRAPAGRYLYGYTGVVWDRAASIPAPGPAMIRLYNELLGK
jgi:O-methyltransferase